MHNLADKKEKLVQELCSKMESQLKHEGDPRMFGLGDVFDTYKYSGRDSGYYNRRMAGEKIEASWLNPDDRNYVPLEQ